MYCLYHAHRYYTYFYTIEFEEAEYGADWYGGNGHGEASWCKLYGGGDLRFDDRYRDLLFGSKVYSEEAAKEPRDAAAMGALRGAARSSRACPSSKIT